MAQAFFRFFGELNDFLPSVQREQTLVAPLNGSVTVKHLIESLGPPHPEIEAIFANQEPVNFEYVVQSGDRVDVHPVSTVNGVVRVRPLRPPLTPPLRFVLDTHLGQLATYLRLLGFDALYRNDFDDAELAQISATETRVLLTRDRGLLKRKCVIYGYCVRVSEPRQQLVDLLRRYRLTAAIQPWRRCLRCNGLLRTTAKAAILDQLEPKTRLFYDDFQQCDTCGQIYWQGSHHARMEAFVTEIMAAVNCEL
ncbi:MAG: twitching motility protein PilT [Chloroflexi bacterium]|nr:MAG: twitching motility protein PilT [Chloroflexota bacterium]